MATPKQEKLVKLIESNLLNSKNTESLESLLLEAGYSESQAKSARQIIDGEGVQEGLSDTVNKMKKIRDKALKALEGKNLDDEKAKDIVDIADKIQKNIQLLTGGDTERVGIKPVLVKFIDEKPTNN